MQGITLDQEHFAVKILPGRVAKGFRMNLMILAAGYGTRLRPLTDIRPKALCPVWGKPLLERWIWQAAEEGFRRVVVNAHHMPQKMTEYFESHSWPIPVQVLVEQEILGTGGGVRQALEVLDDATLMVVNADVAAKVSLRGLVAIHQSRGAPATMLLCRTHRFDTVRVNAEGTAVTGFCPLTTASGQSGLWTFTGIHVLEPSALRSMPLRKPFHIIDVYKDWIAHGTPPAAVCQEHLWWLDMGSLESYWNLHAAYDRIPDDGVRFLGIAPSGVWLHPSATVASSAQLTGVVVGEASTVERDCVLHNVILWKGCRIEPETMLENCLVTDGAVVWGRHRNAIFLPSAAPVFFGQAVNPSSPSSHSMAL